MTTNEQKSALSFSIGRPRPGQGDTMLGRVQRARGDGEEHADVTPGSR
jgi:hypothetical protein